MSIRLDVEAIERLWAGEGNGESVWLLMPGVGDLDSRDRLAVAIEGTNDALSDWLDEGGYPAVGRPPLRTEAGAVWEVECFHSAGPRRWVEELAGRLGPAGLSGEVRARPYPDVGRFDTVDDDQTSRSAAVVLAPSGWVVDTRKVVFGEVRHVPESRGLVVPSWKVDHGQVPDLIELVMDFLVDEPSRSLLQVGTHSEVSRGALGSLLSVALMTPRGQEPQVSVTQFSWSVNRSVSFDRQGRVLLTTVAAEDALADHVRRACDLAIAWASRCDWVLSLENSLSPSFEDAYLNARGAKLPREVARGRLRDGDPLPDAYPRAVLTTVQLPPSLDPNRWSVAPLDQDRFVVETKNLPAWFAGPEKLLEARRDWAIGE